MSRPIDEEEIYHIARALAEDERTAYLAQVCASDEALKQRVNALLKANEDAQSLLNSAPSLASTDRVPKININVGQTIGPYKLLQQIGEGGMGTVYMADQSQPVSRRVALKVIKPGMDSKVVVARFEAERQALAMMDHPNIARVFDAGTTDHGCPYFVMELVKGIPITEYCDRHKLSIRDRLDLFIQVCHAVQHAHQKGIIHRDIKPSNVLVAKYDDKPVPKVIDFGVAKAISHRLTEKTMFTQFGQIIGTLEYMSPEQAQFNQLDVDTRSDIYSLGVLLYELLTGETPFDRERLRSSAFDEVLRILRDEEPPRPSLRIRDSESSIASASNRQLDVKKLDGLIKGDLDWIVMRSLEKERARRYDSATSLAEDVQRYLTDEVVEARPPSATYRLGKLYQRNKAVTFASTVCLIALVIGAVGATWAWRNAIENERAMDDQRKAAVRMLNLNRELIIQRALLKAFEADTSEVNEIVEEYAGILGDDDDQWPTILQATACWHAGDYGQAKQHILNLGDHPARRSIPAMAILSAAYSYDGEFDKGIMIANELRGATPRDAYLDVDRLFLGYGLIFVDVDQAVEHLEKVVEKHPNWLVCHAMLADAWLHAGNMAEDDSRIHSALEKSSAILALLGDNPFALEVSLFAHRMTIEHQRLAEQDYTELVPQGRELARRLQQHPDFILAHAMPGQFFDAIDDTQNAEAAWMEVLRRGKKMWQWIAIGRLYWNMTSQELIELLQTTETERQPNLWRLAAKAYLLADMPGGKAAAMKAFHRIAAEHSSSLDQYYAIHIPLLLGEKELAIQTARQWLGDQRKTDLTGDTSSEFSSDHFLQLIASDGELTPNAKNRASKVMISHVRGLLAIASGDRDSAIEHFTAAAAIPRINLECYWSEAFLRRLNDSDAWPCENGARR